LPRGRCAAEAFAEGGGHRDEGDEQADPLHAAQALRRHEPRQQQRHHERRRVQEHRQA
jgi:hypothetical protein